MNPGSSSGDDIRSCSNALTKEWEGLSLSSIQTKGTSSEEVAISPDALDSKENSAPLSHCDGSASSMGVDVGLGSVSLPMAMT